MAAECKVCSRKRSNNYREENKERRHELYEIYYSKDKIRYNSNSKRWAKGNEERNKINQENYRSSEKGKQKYKIYNYNRLNKNHEITADEWENCKLYFNHACAYCGLYLEDHYVTYNKKLIWTDLHKEHVIHDGSKDLSNCVPACKSCNCSKNTKDVEQWYKEQSFYDELKYSKIIMWVTNDFKKYKSSLN